MLTIAGLRHTFDGVDALTIDELNVADGSFVSLIGPSGCGKSTLLKIVAGVIEPTNATIMLHGDPLPRTPGFAGFMPQHDRLLPWRNAMDNAILAADIAGKSREASRARAAALFERFGLAGYEEAWPHQLSGGMRQRLALLRTFLTDRDLLLLDEPFGALDAITRRRMHAWLREVLASDRRTVLFVTHDVDEALTLSDRVLVMSARPGRIIADLAVGETSTGEHGDATDPAFIEQRAELFRLLESAQPT